MLNIPAKFYKAETQLKRLCYLQDWGGTLSFRKIESYHIFIILVPLYDKLYTIDYSWSRKSFCVECITIYPTDGTTKYIAIEKD